MQKIYLISKIVAHVSDERREAFFDSRVPETLSRTSKKRCPYPLHGVALALAVVAGVVVQAKSDELPSTIEVQGATAVQTLHAEGVQIYECKPGEGGAMQWKFREPLATLLHDDKTVGRHFAGPGWELLDGSVVTGKVVALASGETARDIPWLRLEAAAHMGQGGMSEITLVQRIHTRGGVFAGACSQAGAIHLEPYSADYVFLKN